MVASFYPMQFLAEQIGGDHVSVTTLTKPGVEPHDLELSPRQIGELGDADFILYLKGIQPAVDEADRPVRGRGTPSTRRRSPRWRTTARRPAATSTARWRTTGEEGRRPTRTSGWTR